MISVHEKKQDTCDICGKSHLIAIRNPEEREVFLSVLFARITIITPKGRKMNLLFDKNSGQISGTV